jgi:phosphotransferase system IIB component
MPCYTRVSVEVKDEAAAKSALEALGYRATITKNANGTFSVTAQGTNFDETRFRNEYSAQVTTKKAKAAGYSVIRKESQNQIELVLRAYN